MLRSNELLRNINEVAVDLISISHQYIKKIIERKVLTTGK